MVARLILSFMLLLQGTVIVSAQNVGINMATPTAPLHVVRLAPTSGPKSNHVMAILESDDESFIQLSTAENAATGFLSGDRWTAIRSSMIFGGDSSILFKSGGDIPRLMLTNKGRVGINTISPLAQLHVKDSSVLFTGTIPLPAFPADPPVSGVGVRMMWYAEKGALRSGFVNNTKWNKENIGNFSIVLGYDGMAKGVCSSAFGAYGTASGEASTVFGYGGQAIGHYSFAHNWTTAKSYACFTTGAYNDTTSLSSVGWNLNDPLFIIGNGTAPNLRNNAMTVLKNAKTGINTETPQSMLHVVRNQTSPGPYAVNAIATFESNSSSWIHLKHPNTAQAAILSGNEETNVRSGLLFDIDSSMLFRTGGNYNRMKLNKSGYLGINTLTPRSLLHIRQGGDSGGPSHWQALATLESSYSGFLQFSQAIDAEAGILSGNTATEIRSAMIFGIDSSMHFRTGGNFTRMKLNKSGYLGINTTTPQSLLHILKSGSSGGPVHGYALATLESNINGYLQFSQTTNTEAGILSGNSLTEIRSAMVFAADSSIHFRTGGNFNRMYLSKMGRLGIGTNTPGALLHLHQGSAGGGTTHPFATAVIEKASNSCLQFKTPAGSWAAIVSTDPTSQARSGIYFTDDGSLELKTGGHSYAAITVDEYGKTGIGTSAPGGLLDVNGTFRLGYDGSTLEKITQNYMPYNLPSIANGSSYTATFSIPIVAQGGTVDVSPSADLPDGLIIAYAYATTGAVHVKFTNVTTAAINPPSANFYITVIQ